MKALTTCWRFLLRSGSILSSLALSSFILICGGYILGWNTVATPKSAVPDINVSIEAGVTHSAAGVFANPAPGAPRRTSTGVTNSLVRNIRPQILRIAANLRPGFRERESGAVAMSEIAKLSAREIHASLDGLKDAPQNRSFHGLRMMLLNRWIRLDPHAAFDYVQNNTLVSPILMRNEKLEDVMIHVWAGHDPEAALEKWRSLPEEKRSSPYRTGRIIGAMAQKDFHLALNTIETLPKDYHYEALRGMSRSAQNEADRELMFERVNQLSSMKERTKVTSQILHGWGRDTKPENVVNWLDQSDLPRKEFNEVENKLGRIWFYEDHQAAADWLIARADSPGRRGEILEDMTSIWTTYDPAGAAEWLNNQELDASAAPAMRTLAERIARHHPEDAIEWINAITVKRERERAVKNVTQTIRKNYPHKADALLRRL